MILTIFTMFSRICELFLFKLDRELAKKNYKKITEDEQPFYNGVHQTICKDKTITPLLIKRVLNFTYRNGCFSVVQNLRQQQQQNKIK